jgi:hypothetical protein
VPRHRLLTRSIVLAGASILAAVALMALGTIAGSRIFDAAGFDLPSFGTRMKLLAHLAGVAACFAGFGLFVTSFSRRWMTAFTTAALTAVVMYLVDFLAIGWRPMKQIVWISPFHYYPALSIVAGDAPMARDLTVLVSAAAAFTLAAYLQFQRRDL